MSASQPCCFCELCSPNSLTFVVSPIAELSPPKASCEAGRFSLITDTNSVGNLVSFLRRGSSNVEFESRFGESPGSWVRRALLLGSSKSDDSPEDITFAPAATSMSLLDTGGFRTSPVGDFVRGLPSLRFLLLPDLVAETGLGGAAVFVVKHVALLRTQSVQGLWTSHFKVHQQLHVRFASRT